MTDETRRADASARASQRSSGRSTGVLRRLAPLNDLPSYKVADGDPDVRGLDVETTDGEKIGEVHDLIVDVAAMKVRYLDVDVDNALLDTEEDWHILVPVGCATLNADADVIDLTNVSSADLPSIPGYSHGPITRDFESAVRDCYTAAAARQAGSAGAARTASGEATTVRRRAGAAQSANVDADAAFYGHEFFDERRFFGNRHTGPDDTPHVTRAGDAPATEERAASAGGGNLMRRVERDDTAQQAPVTRAGVSAERRPAQPGAPAHSELAEKEVRIPVMEEDAAARKRAVQSEEPGTERRRKRREGRGERE